MSTPDTNGNEPDTTTGGGGDYDGGANDPAYRASDDQYEQPNTTDTSGSSQGGHTGSGTTVTPGPAATQPDTTSGGALGGVGRTGDTDSHSHDPAQVGDTTVLGGGVGASSTGQAYQAPPADSPATNFDTSGRGGFLRVNSGSPDAAAVGNDSGLNPNAVEPSANPSGYAVTQKDTTSAGAPAFVTVPTGSTPAAPGKPTVAAISGRTAVHVTWTAPSGAVAAGVLGYIITSNTGGTTEVGKNNLSVEFEQGLIPGDVYTFTVYARTAQGTGPRSAASDPFTMPKPDNLVADEERDEGLSGPAHNLPGTPAAPTATTGVSQASVAFTAPTSDGGDPITEYTVVSTPGGFTKVGTASPLVVTGLTAGTPYTFKVKAKNGFGYGPLSAASNSVTPT
jgi:hypothetical protein